MEKLETAEDIELLSDEHLTQVAGGRTQVTLAEYEQILAKMIASGCRGDSRLCT